MTPEPSFSPANLRRNILLPLALTLLLGLAALYLLALTHLRTDIDHEIARDVATSENLYRDLVRLHADSMAGEIRILARDPALRQAMRAGDRDRLLAAATPLFKEALKPYGVTHFYVHTPDGTNFLRVHQPARHGDRIQRETLRQASASGALAAGVELGPLGTFTLRVVLPWGEQGELLGYLELGKEVEELLTYIHHISDNQVAVILEKQYLDEAGWRSGAGMLGRGEDWGRFRTRVVVDETHPGIAAALGSLPDESEALETVAVRLVLAGQEHRGRFLPLPDAAGQRVGYLLILHNTSPKLREFSRTLALLSILVLVLGGGSISLYNRLLRRAEQRLDGTQLLLLREYENTSRIKEDLELEMEVRLAAEAALEKSRDDLEATVARRTEELYRQQDLLRRILDHIPSHVFWKDRTLTYLGCNAGFARLLGLETPDQVVGKRDLDLPWASNRLLAWQQEDRQVLASGAPVLRKELELRQADDTQHWYLVSLIPLRDQDQRISGLVGIFSDITERKQRELALLAMLEDASRVHSQVEGVFHSVNDPVLVFDDSHHLTMLNPAGERLLDRPRARALGAPLDELLPPSPLRETLHRVLEHPEEQTRSEALLPAAERRPERRYEIRQWKVPRRGELGGTVLLLRDITQEYKLNRLKSDFIATAAHELRTPLATVLGFAELLLMEESLTPAQQLEFKTLIYENADHLRSLLDDLLDINRIEAGHALELQREPLPVAELIEPVLSRWRASSPGHQFRVELRAPEKVLDIDLMRVRQILDNLIGNAVKYAPRGGEIRISGAPEQGERYRLTISDQGIGMKPEDVARAFDPFFRAHPSAFTVKGAGLGLSIVKTLVEAHGGSIRLSSREGEGTSVTFTLPCARTDQHAAKT